MGRPRVGRQDRQKRNQTSTTIQTPHAGSTAASSGMDEAGSGRMMAESVPRYGTAATTMRVDGEVGYSRQREDYGSQDSAVEMEVIDELASSSTFWDSGLGTPSTTNISLLPQAQMPLSEVYPETSLLPDQFHPTYNHQGQRVLEPAFASRVPETLIQGGGKFGQFNSDDQQDAKKCLHAYGHNIKPGRVFSSRRFESEDLPERTGTSLMEVYGQLSQLLFALHRAQDTFPGGRRNGGSGDRRAIESIFFLVSSLCDVVTWLRKSASGAPDDTISPCLLLAISVVSTVVEIYQRALDGFKDVWPLGDPSTLPQPSPPALCDPGLTLLHRLPYHAHTRLRMLSDAIAMDFHLEQLQIIFIRALPDAGGSQTQPRLEQVRKGLQALMEEWRTPIR